MKTRAEINQEKIEKEQKPVIEAELITAGMYEFISGGTSIVLVLQDKITSYSLPYTYYQGASFNPKTGLTIYHSAFYAEIKGRNLKPLVKLLNEYSLASVRVANHAEPEEFETHIDSIKVMTMDEYRELKRLEVMEL